MLFSIVIATCGRPDRLKECLAAIDRAIGVAGEDHRVIVVDNGPGYQAAGVVQASSEQSGIRMRYLQSEPLNKSKALNRGIADADTEWIAFTDDDALPDENWLKSGSEFAARAGYRIFGGRIVMGVPDKPLPASLQAGPDGEMPGGGVFVYYHPLVASGQLRDSDKAPFGANVFVRKDVFDQYGPYDEELWKLCGKAALGVDDGEFGVRIKESGEPIGYCHESFVVHPVHSEKYGIWHRMQHAYYFGWRDRIVFWRPNRPLLEMFLVRQAFGIAGRAVANLLCGRWARTHTDLVETARVTGKIAGRLSPAYGERARMVLQREEDCHE